MNSTNSRHQDYPRHPRNQLKAEGSADQKSGPLNFVNQNDSA